MSIIPQDTTRNNTIFKVDPEFRDKIPPLTDAEFEQLKENILSAGEVYEPICVWNGTIVDGHNRWRIIQEHPEIPFKVKEMGFSDKWEAFDWMYANQLGRRNLTGEQKTYILGKLYEVRKQRYGGDRKSSLQNEDLKPGSRTAAIVAREQGVGQSTVERAEHFVKGIDKAAEVDPEFKREVLSGEVKAKKSDLAAIRKLESEEEVKAAVEAIRNPPPKPHKPKVPTDPEAAAKRAEARELDKRIHEIAEDMRKTDIAAYTQQDLERDLTLITERAVRDIRQELTIRKKSITDTEALVEILVACERELAEVETELTKGVYAK